MHAGAAFAAAWDSLPSAPATSRAVDAQCPPWRPVGSGRGAHCAPLCPHLSESPRVEPPLQQPGPAPPCTCASPRDLHHARAAHMVRWGTRSVDRVTSRAVETQCSPWRPVGSGRGAHCSPVYPHSNQMSKPRWHLWQVRGHPPGPRGRIRRSRQRQQVSAPDALRMGMTGFNSPGQLAHSPTHEVEWRGVSSVKQYAVLLDSMKTRES
jgi:hypothetical protein